MLTEEAERARNESGSCSFRNDLQDPLIVLWPDKSDMLRRRSTGKNKVYCFIGSSNWEAVLVVGS